MTKIANATIKIIEELGHRKNLNDINIESKNKPIDDRIRPS